MIVVVAKKPEPGQVKTRLCPPLTSSQAARLAEAFLRETVSIAFDSGAGDVAVGYAPATSRRWFAKRWPGATLLEQPEGDLGTRMSALFMQAFTANHGSVILIGTDTPHLPPLRIREARDALERGADAVFGPADDGGYYLVGLRRPAPGLFAGIAWSRETVLRETLARAEQEHLRVALLPAERDIDRPEDLAWLTARPEFARLLTA